MLAWSAARKPQGAVSLQSLQPGQYVLKGLVQRMSHVKLSCNVWRRHHNGKRFFIRIALCLKGCRFLPTFRRCGPQNPLDYMSLPGFSPFLSSPFICNEFASCARICLNLLLAPAASAACQGLFSVFLPISIRNGQNPGACPYINGIFLKFALSQATSLQCVTHLLAKVCANHP